MGPATQDRHSLSQTERPVLPDRRRNAIIVQRIAILPSSPPAPPRAPEGWSTGFAENLQMVCSSASVFLSKSMGTTAGLGWVGLGWPRLGRPGLGWAGLGWTGLGWAGLAGAEAPGHGGASEMSPVLPSIARDKNKDRYI